MKAILMLEDGKTFTGSALASVAGERIGEVIMNTAVVGYQEMLTDPANANKIVLFTYPLIGNYGAARKFNASARVWAQAAVIKEKSRIYSNWQAQESFDDFVKNNNLLVLANVDTRSLAVHIRQKGQMLAIITTACTEARVLSQKLQDYRRQAKPSLLPELSVGKITPLGKPGTRQKRIAILDLGVNASVIAQLQTMGMHVTLVPYDTGAPEILRLKPHGLVISGGPEQDPNLGIVTETLKGLIGKVPLLGISCGHQVLAQVLGGRIVKMKLGHHGVNYPIHDPASYKGEITAQNHSYVVDGSSLAKVKDVRITGYNLNDRSVEEIESRKRRCLGVQYEPVSPGFREVNPAFTKFAKMMERSS